MKVILCEDVDNLGHMGDTVNVASGYFRNFLQPRKYAVAADSASAKQIEHEMHIIKRREQKRRKQLLEVKGKLDGVKLEFTARAGENGKLFGSITSLHIAEKLNELGHSVDRRKIQLKEPLKSLGEHKVGVRMMKDLEAVIKVTVVADETAVPEPVEAPVVDVEFDDEEVGTMAAVEAAASKPRKPRAAKREVEAEPAAESAPAEAAPAGES